jgi:hypothetical protein
MIHQKISLILFASWKSIKDAARNQAYSVRKKKMRLFNNQFKFGEEKKYRSFITHPVIVMEICVDNLSLLRDQGPML